MILTTTFARLTIPSPLCISVCRLVKILLVLCFAILSCVFLLFCGVSFCVVTLCCITLFFCALSCSFLCFMCFLRVLCAFCDVSFVLCPYCARGALMGSARGVVFVVVCACCDRVDVFSYSILICYLYSN